MMLSVNKCNKDCANIKELNKKERECEIYCAQLPLLWGNNVKKGPHIDGSDKDICFNESAA